MLVLLGVRFTPLILLEVIKAQAHEGPTITTTFVYDIAWGFHYYLMVMATNGISVRG
jgi:hypothetical protein